MTALSTATGAGTSFIFGYIGGGPAPFTVTHPANMINLAFGILPLVMVISAVGDPVVLARAAGHRAWHGLVLKRSLGLGGAVGLGAAATVFLGNIEGQLVIRPYLARLTRTELFILMTVGLSVIAGTVFVLYATILKDVLPGALGHLLVASLMSLPAGMHDGAHHGARARRHRPHAKAGKRALPLHHGCDGAGHRGRAENLSADPGHADRHDLADGAGQCHPGASARRRRARR